MTSAQSFEEWKISNRLEDAGLLSPDPKYLGALAPVAACGHEKAPRPEVTVDHAVCEEEILCLTRRLEPLHLPFSSWRGPVRILGTIVEISARAMADAGQDGAPSHAVAAQAVGNEVPRLILQSAQQTLEEAPRRRTIPPLLHQNVEYDAVLIHSAP
jgi:hypothetical protein